MSSPAHKVAMLFRLLEENQVVEIVQRLPPADARRVLRALAKLEVLETEQLDRVVQEFLDVIRSVQPVPGTQESAGAKILAAARACLNDPEFERELQASGGLAELRTFLREIQPESLTKWLEGQRPAVGAFVLSVAESAVAARAFEKLRMESQVQVCLQMAAIEEFDLQLIDELLEEIRILHKGAVTRMRVGGTEAVSRMLENLDPATRTAILDQMRGVDAGLADELEKQQLSLERISSLLPRDLERVCSRISDRDFVLVLKAASEAVKSSFLAVVSTGRRERLTFELASLGPVRRSDADAAVARLAALVKALRDEGSIVYPWEDRLV